MVNLKSYISDKLSEEIISFGSVSGGDISSAYRIETSTGRFFLKVNSAPFAREMFNAEQIGLQAIEATKTIAVPHVHWVDTFDGKSFLMMDFVESKRPNEADFQRLGTQLACLHQWLQNGLQQSSQTDFGFPSNNFIGSLPQSNRVHTDWPQFYWFERILPQLQMARKEGLLQPQMIPHEEKALARLQEILFIGIPGDIKPSILHGDLWGGNYLIATDGTPYLIDPAVYYGHSMVDIAMSRLFGGFSTAFYDAYHEIIPKSIHYEAQIELYQLYYLLVHLNLFGSGYYSSVASILKRF